MLTTALPESAAAPDWIEIIPAGPEITGVDGRRWLNDLPHHVVANSKIPLVVDHEHASEHLAPKGMEAPAAGWIDRLEVRGDSSIWGHVDWTERAAQQIQAQEYRYLSPCFLHEKGSGRIVRLTSIGLTNQPNLSLKALNQQGVDFTLSPEERHVARLFGRTEAEAIADKQAFLADARNTRTAIDRLTPEERRVCEVMGVDPVEFLTRKEQTA